MKRANVAWIALAGTEDTTFVDDLDQDHLNVQHPSEQNTLAEALYTIAQRSGSFFINTELGFCKPLNRFH